MMTSTMMRVFLLCFFAFFCFLFLVKEKYQKTVGFCFFKSFIRSTYLPYPLPIILLFCFCASPGSVGLDWENSRERTKRYHLDHYINRSTDRPIN